MTTRNWVRINYDYRKKKKTYSKNFVTFMLVRNFFAGFTKYFALVAVSAEENTTFTFMFIVFGTQLIECRM